jgi:hypothetical protein
MAVAVLRKEVEELARELLNVTFMLFNVEPRLEVPNLWAAIRERFAELHMAIIEIPDVPENIADYKMLVEPVLTICEGLYVKAFQQLKNRVDVAPPDSITPEFVVELCAVNREALERFFYVHSMEYDTSTYRATIAIANARLERVCKPLENQYKLKSPWAEQVMKGAFDVLPTCTLANMKRIAAMESVKR